MGWVAAPVPPSSDDLCGGNFAGTFGGSRDAYLGLDNSSGSLLGTMVIENPEAQYSIEGSCEQTTEDYANFEFTLVPGGVPYVGTIYAADDGNIYIEGEQQGTGLKFVMRREQ